MVNLYALLIVKRLDVEVRQTDGCNDGRVFDRAGQLEDGQVVVDKTLVKLVLSDDFGDWGLLVGEFLLWIVAADVPVSQEHLQPIYIVHREKKIN